MSSPLYARSVSLPPELLYCPKISAVILHTWAQIRGLADDNDELKLKQGMMELVSITGKFKQTLYGHLASLRDMQALRFASSKDGELFIKFSDRDFLAYASKIFTCPPSLTPDHKEVDSNREGLRERASKIFDQKRESKDPLLSHPAVMAYRSVFHLTANFTQRKQIAEMVGYDDQGWRAAMEHWAMHGYKPTNLLGMLDSYKKGGAAGCNACNHNNGAKPAASANGLTAEIARRKARLANGNGSGNSGSV